MIRKVHTWGLVDTQVLIQQVWGRRVSLSSELPGCCCCDLRTQCEPLGLKSVAWRKRRRWLESRRKGEEREGEGAEEQSYRWRGLCPSVSPQYRCQERERRPPGHCPAAFQGTVGEWMGGGLCCGGWMGRWSAQGSTAGWGGRCSLGIRSPTFDLFSGIG